MLAFICAHNSLLSYNTFALVYLTFCVDLMCYMRVIEMNHYLAMDLDRGLGEIIIREVQPHILFLFLYL